MTKRLEIETTEGTFIHLESPFNEMTLCGLESMGDIEIGISEGVYTKERVTCPQCKQIIRHVGQYLTETSAGR